MIQVIKKEFVEVEQDEAGNVFMAPFKVEHVVKTQGVEVDMSKHNSCDIVTVEFVGEHDKKVWLWQVDRDPEVVVEEHNESEYVSCDPCLSWGRVKVRSRRGRQSNIWCR